MSGSHEAVVAPVQAPDLQNPPPSFYFLPEDDDGCREEITRRFGIVSDVSDERVEWLTLMNSTMLNQVESSMRFNEDFLSYMYHEDRFDEKYNKNVDLETLTVSEAVYNAFNNQKDLSVVEPFMAFETQ